MIFYIKESNIWRLKEQVLVVKKTVAWNCFFESKKHHFIILTFLILIVPWHQYLPHGLIHKKYPFSFPSGPLKLKQTYFPALKSHAL